MSYAVETRDLTRVFSGKKKRWWRRKPTPDEEESLGPVTALDGVSLQIREGELFGLLGPNGAGKTTLIKILATLLLPTSGQALVAGHDVTKDPFPIRQRINMVSGGETSGYGLLTARENIWMFSQFYGVPSKVSKARIDELMHIFGLWDKRDAKVRMLSTGQRQKMNMIRGFVTGPDILFLDEPTLGLDVNAARVIREYVMNWVRGQAGKTVLLTSHYMAEADQMCDRIAIIDKGRILACDTPANLKRMIRTETTFQLEVDTIRDTTSFMGLQGVKNFSHKDDISKNRSHLTFILEDEGPVAEILSSITSQGAKVHSLQKSEPTLEDVFISMVGRGLD
ncbi:MAG: ATP-binding cassette domain-containing protein [Methanobacteriota archaeon]|nr:MAG: ATP-binding cassette domain-containing protein [Euryarchaeota archaeon]TLZ81081.1 MAG: ATP-binding cassette domain-containing protein [Euryarchaeota archaeon]